MRVGIIGSTGRMGTLIRTLLSTRSSYDIGPGFSRESPHTLPFVIENSDVLVDFSSSGLTEKLIDCLLENAKPCILGTTQTSSSTVEDKLRSLAQYVPIVVCPNTSLGAYVQKRLSAALAKILDSSYDIRITEIHHQGKKEPISGTAWDLATTLCQVKHEEWQQEYSIGNQSNHGKSIELHALRVGNVPGEHEVTFVSDQEQITIRHTVFSREVFAKGVLRILDWLRIESPGPGYYGIESGLRDFI
ncbi:4-hydroxy-tetrahydrodipicolinate reductase [Chlamydia avium]|uniref:4-hydroxy-tetrahydrodipicolinate reductase n=2 Tax=Chlamydia avium TaxID=1457141 RepID=W8JFK7_9CHLA|nr:4-hydroxy-tetrahydrodipicolinate reductase [Chlamydia avium]AHK63346.1 4-hydroxy-tetrahydrodipicolinate reductase [Chlamydia avium 10DC88]EPP36038.1 dihydrodipicolinate reductase [Chlamydia psittaci 10_743_SC13]EPP38408.1 dihydrodipicolinate reductase [Chlamydia avium]VVT42947.1 4-hydroxy-tetrahydrodipicolinate reductase [Chlamydia avium]